MPCLDWLLNGAGCLEVGFAATRDITITEEDVRKQLADQEKAPNQEQA
eukprot:CAMPEP_0185431288 /NCGR_PEP_ID=MMETSP1365-20130426/18002_1 /TAXON_ID=38817 /ORGANISM="Gephyrocapsa oceanica, Strain RCC1303" /LENGTH=47 /DNA_ID= /DNA_START= /DNA_END= /DNA_ORIENTATION=